MIEAVGVGFQYEVGDRLAVEEVTIRAERDQIIGIVGPNGSGKSTVARLFKGLLLPTSGSIRVDGLETREHTEEARRRVGLVFQNPNSQIVNAVVEQEVAFGLENMAVDPPAIRQRVASTLAAVGLTDRAQSECHRLTMADKQRVALASVLAMQPIYLVLDEPTAWLEPSSRWSMLDDIFSFCKDREIGVILITHRMDEAEACGHLYGMLDGRVEVEGSPESVLQQPEIRERLSLDLPESFHLAAELAEAGVTVSPGAAVPRIVEALCRS